MQIRSEIRTEIREITPQEKEMLEKELARRDKKQIQTPEYLELENTGDTGINFLSFLKDFVK